MFPCRPSHLSLFTMPNREPREHLLAQDVVYVGGGSTPNMLAVWRVHGIDEILREAWRSDVVLAGISAGANCWFEHYRGANQVTRERLISYPRLFLQALRESGEARALERLRAGPEGECVADARTTQTLIVRLRKRLPRLCEQSLPEALVHALAHLRLTLEAFLPELKSYCEHDRRGDLHGGARDERPRPLAARDQPGAQALA